MQAGSTTPPLSYFDWLPRELKSLIIAYMLGSSGKRIKWEHGYKFIYSSRCMFCLKVAPYIKLSKCYNCNLSYFDWKQLPRCDLCSKKNTCAWCLADWKWKMGYSEQH